MSFKIVTLGDVIRAVVTSLVAALLIVGAGCAILAVRQAGQTPNGLGG